jgi:hypothetical protein
MAKRVCDICGEKFGFFSLGADLSDGTICRKCLTQNGMTSISNPKLHSLDEVHQAIDVRKELIKAFSPTKIISIYLKIDENNQCFKVSNDFFTFDNLLSYELLEDGETVTKGGLGRAVAGRVLFGDVGAIVGSVTGGKKSKGICKSMKLKITLKNALCDVIYISFITSETKENSFTYKSARDNAQKCISALEIILDSNKNRNDKTVQISSFVASSADEIAKFKNLLDDGVITQEEFDAKKKQLLDL